MKFCSLQNLRLSVPSMHVRVAEKKNLLEYLKAVSFLYLYAWFCSRNIQFLSSLRKPSLRLKSITESMFILADFHHLQKNSELVFCPCLIHQGSYAIPVDLRDLPHAVVEHCRPQEQIIRKVGVFKELELLFKDELPGKRIIVC